jgi:hypothetical protein
MSKRYVRVVNMIPKSLSGETNQDSEPQITIDPEHPSTIVGTAFTPDPAGGPDGPLYVSHDNGHTWTLDLAIPGEAFVPSIGQILPTFDQSVRFGHGSALYAGILRTNSNTMDILRSAPFTSGGVMAVVTNRNSIDQPYVATKHANGRDRVFVGNNDASSGPYRGSVDHSPDARTAPPPAGFVQTALDPRVPFLRELPPIRCAAHRDGTVYAAYIPARSFAATNTLCDVVVARDDNFATGASPFTDLIDPGDGLAGLRVRQSAPFPWTSPFTYLGFERIGSNLSIAVEPEHSREVYLAWGEGPFAGSAQTLRVRRSNDHGATWSGDLVTIANAINPALAVTEDHKVGLLYQEFVTVSGVNRWRTHIQVTHDAWKTPAEDILLADTPEDPATYPLWDPHLGDYIDLQAHGRDFYGIFSTNNTPDRANFPQGVRYQRNADFTGKQLYDVSGVTPVAASIDPFFAHIYWRDEEREEGLEEREERGERLRIKSLRYERLEIDGLSIDLDGDDEDGPVALLEHVDSGLRHLARRLEAELRERRKRRRDKH